MGCEALSKWVCVFIWECLVRQNTKSYKRDSWTSAQWMSCVLKVYKLDVLVLAFPKKIILNNAWFSWSGRDWFPCNRVAIMHTCCTKCNRCQHSTCGVTLLSHRVVDTGVCSGLEWIGPSCSLRSLGCMKWPHFSGFWMMGRVRCRAEGKWFSGCSSLIPFSQWL